MGCLPNVPSGRNRDQVRQSLQRQIGEIKQASDVERARLGQLLDAERNRGSSKSTESGALKSGAQDQDEVLSLKSELDTLERDRQSRIESCYARNGHDIDDKVRANALLAKDYEAQVDQGNARLQKLKDDFEKIGANPEDELRRVRERALTDYAAVAKESEALLRETKHRHITTMDRLKKELQDFHGRVRKDSSLYQTQMNQDRNEKEGLVADRERKICEGISQQQADWEGNLSMLVERIEVLTAALDSLRVQFETRDGRQCDNDTIDALTLQLRAVSALLRSKLKEFAQYKTLLIEQEKIYNAHFGKSRSVGIFQYLPEMVAGPRSARV
jgi:hypothetical protein